MCLTYSLANECEELRAKNSWEVQRHLHEPPVRARLPLEHRAGHPADRARRHGHPPLVVPRSLPRLPRAHGLLRWGWARCKGVSRRPRGGLWQAAALHGVARRGVRDCKMLATAILDTKSSCESRFSTTTFF